MKVRIEEIPGKRQIRVAARMRDGFKLFLSDGKESTWVAEPSGARIWEDYGDARLEAKVRVELERSEIFDTLVLEENGNVISAHMWDKDVECPNVNFEEL